MAELERGSIFAGHRIEGVAGRGGFGIVYRATHIALDHVVALKLISTGRAEDETFRDRFKSESRIAVSIRHPNVVAVHNAGEEDGLLFVTMDFIDGTDLRGLLNREARLPPDRTVALVGQIAAALDAAHERGLVHRDIKPGNVLVEQRNGAEHVYLTDFGLSKQMDATSGVTASGAFVGTLDYVAPEQIRGDRLDARTDVYALGCVTFELLSGRVPFEQEDKIAKIYAHLQEEPPELIDAAPEVPAALSEVVWRAMAKDPEARQPSAGDFARAAEAALEGRAPSEPERNVGVGAAAPTQAFDVLAAGAAGAAAAPDTAEAAAPAAASSATRTAETTPPEATAPPPSEPSTAREAPRPTSRAGGRRRLLALGVVAAVAAAAGAFALLGGGGEGADEQGGNGGGGGAPKVTSVAEVAEQPVGVAAAGGDVFVSSRAGGELQQVDPSSGEVAGTFELGGEGEQVVVDPDDGSLWVAVGGESEAVAGRVVHLAPDLGEVGEPILVEREPRGLAVGEDAVWVANLESDSVSRIDPATGETTLITGMSGPARVAVGEGAVWVSNSDADTVTRITDAGERTEDVSGVGSVPRGVEVAGGSVWVAAAESDHVARINPETLEVEDTVPVGNEPRTIDFGLGYLWVTNGKSGSVSRIDPQTLDTLEVQGIGPSPEAVAIDEDGGVVYATAGPEGAPGTLKRIEP